MASLHNGRGKESERKNEQALLQGVGLMFCIRAYIEDLGRSLLRGFTQEHGVSKGMAWWRWSQGPRGLFTMISDTHRKKIVISDKKDNIVAPAPIWRGSKRAGLCQ